MKYKLLFVLIPLISLFSTNSAQAIERVDPSVTQSVIVTTIEKKPFDQRAQILNAYLSKYKSNMQYNAQDFVDAADMYNLDWRLVAAIAGVESTFGKHMPGGTDPKFTSYNAWGWGVYGTQAIYFKSFKEGIYTISEGLRKNYMDKGYTEPYSMNKKYAASPTWGSKVSWFLNDIKEFEAEYYKDNPRVAPSIGLSTPVAGQSAQYRVDTSALAYR